MRFLLQLNRISLCCWIAIAAFFVRVGLKPISSPLIDSVTKLHLLWMFFPGYYFAAFTLMGTSLMAGLFSIRSPRIRTRIQSISLFLLALSLLLALIDWFWIYTPLAQMVRYQLDNGTAPPADFRDYHIASRNINMVAVTLAALAMFVNFFIDRQPLTHSVGANRSLPDSGEIQA